MTRRNVLFNLLSSGIACLLLGGLGQTTVPRGFVLTTGSDTNTQAVALVQPGSDRSRAPATDSRVRLRPLQHWIDAHPVRSRIVKTAATLAVFLAFQLLVQPSQPCIKAEAVPAQPRHGRHHHWTDDPAYVAYNAPAYPGDQGQEIMETTSELSIYKSGPGATRIEPSPAK